MNLQFVGQNLAVWDSVKLWDPGQASKNGAYIRYSVLSLYSYSYVLIENYYEKDIKEKPLYSMHDTGNHPVHADFMQLSGS